MIDSIKNNCVTKFYYENRGTMAATLGVAGASGYIDGVISYGFSTMSNPGIATAGARLSHISNVMAKHAAVALVAGTAIALVTTLITKGVVRVFNFNTNFEFEGVTGKVVNFFANHRAKLLFPTTAGATYGLFVAGAISAFGDGPIAPIIALSVSAGLATGLALSLLSEGAQAAYRNITE